MRFAFISDVLYPYVKGGAEKRIWEISTRLVGRGHAVEIYCMKYWDGPKIIKKEGVILHGVCPATSLYTESGRRRIFEALYFSLRLLIPLLRGKYDVCDCNQFPFFPLFTSKICCILKGKKLYSTWHEVWGKSYWRKYLGMAGTIGFMIEKMSVKLPDGFISVSKKTMKGLESLGIEDSKIKVIPNGINLEKFNKAEPGIEKSDLIFAGRLIPEKNVDLLIKAVALIKEDVYCVIVGEGPEKEKLKKLSERIATGRIQFFDFMSSLDLASLMKSSKIFVLPSTREGFGIAVLEANACGLPVLTVIHEKNAAQELISDGAVGLLCNPDEKDLAEKIIYMLSHPKQFKVDEKSRFLLQYDWMNITRKVESYFYTNCIMNKP
ncbi:MAG: glycosyltransferase family 4 protein [Methanobacteriota archaeon]